MVHKVFRDVKIPDVTYDLFDNEAAAWAGEVAGEVEIIHPELVDTLLKIVEPVKKKAKITMNKVSAKMPDFEEVARNVGLSQVGPPEKVAEVGWTVLRKLKSGLQGAASLCWKLLGPFRLPFATLTLGYLLWRLWKVMRTSMLVIRMRDRLRSYLLSKLMKRADHSMRVDFQRNLLATVDSIRSGHPHGEGASFRNGATRGICHAIRQLGFVPFVISGAVRNDKDDGIRDYYFLADFKQEIKHDPLTSRHVIVLIDVDYYLDLPYWLSFGVPIVMYTFVPETVGGTFPEGFFSIKDSFVDFHVSGGRNYVHELWDYNHDVMWSQYSSGWLAKLASALVWCCGLPFGINNTVMDVDQFHVTKNRRIVTLNPIACFPLFVDLGQFGVELGHLKISNNGYNCLTVIDKDSTYVSVGREGAVSSAELPLAKFESMEYAFEIAKNTNLSDTERRAKVVCGLQTEKAIVLHDFLSNGEPDRRAIIHQPGGLAKHFQTTKPLVLEEGKRYARRYAAPPLSEEAVFPVESHNNDTASIEGRVIRPQEEAMERAAKRPQTRFDGYAEEFIEILVPRDLVGVGVPLSVDEVIERQSKPTQRLRSQQRLMDTDETFIVKAFQKREPYSAVNEPRNISQVPTTYTLKYSGFTLAFKSDVLKSQPWYTPGLTPKQIAQQIMKFAHGKMSLHQTDYSRLDGTLVPWIRRNIDIAMYKRWVSLEHYQELSELCERAINPRAVTRTGVKYNPGASRLSGSPDTTDGNTAICAFAAFCCYREMGFDKEAAYLRIGPKNGDDGVEDGALDVEVFERTVKFLGLKLKCKTSKLGEEVEYLSRVFVDPWHTSSSYQDPLRTLLKLHETVDTTSDIKKSGIAKTIGYLTTDGKTPFTGDWCRTYQLNTIEEEFEILMMHDLPWWFRDDKCRAEPWPQGSPEAMLPGIALRLGTDVDSLTTHIEVLKAYRGPVESIPSFWVPPVEPKVEAQVDGEDLLVGGPLLTDVDEETNTNEDEPLLNRTRQSGRSVGGAGAARGGNRGQSGTRRPAWNKGRNKTGGSRQGQDRSGGRLPATRHSNREGDAQRNPSPEQPGTSTSTWTTVGPGGRGSRKRGSRGNKKGGRGRGR